jgi:hypothetical protein
MRSMVLELTWKELEILYASFKRYLDPSTTVLVPEDATLDEMNELSEKLKRELDKESNKL